MRADLAAFVSELPKVELHVHLEGGFTPELIAELAGQAGEPLPVPAADLFRLDSLATLLRRLDWWCGLVRSGEDAARLAYDFAARLASDGVVYAEVIVNPTHWRGLRRRDLIEAVARGFDDAVADGLTDCNVLVSLLREQSRDEALGVVSELAAGRPPRVVGLSIDGNEAVSGPTGERFAPAFALAAEAGLGRTAHAGESSGPEGVVAALDELGAVRIDHGIRAVDAPDLLARLVADDVALNVCLTSNLALVYPSLEEHPIRRLLAAGVSVTINTDDPVPLRTTLSAELLLAARHCGWGEAELVAATERAVRAAFCEPAKKAALLARLGDFAGRSTIC